MPDARERHLQEIERTKAELLTAKEDLQRHLYQQQKDLGIYDRYQKRG